MERDAGCFGFFRFAGSVYWKTFCDSHLEDKQSEIVKVYEREVARLQAERDANRESIEGLQDECRLLGSEVFFSWTSC